MNRKQIIRIAQLTLTAVAASHSRAMQKRGNYPSKKVCVVRPSDLPELARVTGQAMLLQCYRRWAETHLYIEQNQGAQLAIFDVTDPANVNKRARRSLTLPESSTLSPPLETTQNWFGSGTARERRCLNLHKVKVPTLNTIQGMGFQGSTERLGDDGLIIADSA